MTEATRAAIAAAIRIEAATGLTGVKATASDTIAAKASGVLEDAAAVAMVTAGVAGFSGGTIAGSASAAK
jgi:hypothetical protein